ncbi:hypothetical protein JRQ81_003189 [Phrynocephalus forsythii]|uniref:Reverse transcriptase RNase H-like domain-containing protein n=1 Tax=Phrynocephalus forsythii TaxID=171643 RepID=A0A9Q1AWP8_9SAUR|nr:hypothetical protein JRQ81_003189 [Phrynocephalus forsythii]
MHGQPEYPAQSTTCGSPFSTLVGHRHQFDSGYTIPSSIAHLPSNNRRQPLEFVAWSKRQQLMNINQLEMLAVMNAFKVFQTTIEGRTIQLVRDNTMVMFYVNKQGRTHSPSLLASTLALWEWCINHCVHPVATYVSASVKPMGDSRRECLRITVVSDFHATQPLVLPAFFPNPSMPAEQSLHSMDVKKVLLFYMSGTADICKSPKLFICTHRPKLGLPASPQTISKTIVATINLAYDLAQSHLPMGIRAHSTQALSTSTAFMKGVPVPDILKSSHLVLISDICYSLPT